MYFEEVKIPCDLYGRNATKFNQNINSIKENIWIRDIDKECNAKSLLGLLSMGLKKDKEVYIKTDSSNYKFIFCQVKDIISSLENI